MITGAAGQTADAIIRKFAAEGAQLSLVDQDIDELRQRVDHMTQQLGHHIILGADLGSFSEVEAAVEETISRFGKIDVLVHTAGGFEFGTPVHDTDIDVFDRMMTKNARLTFITCGLVARHMLDAELQGRIIAMVAKTARHGAANMAAYSASKAAALRILESMAEELKDHNIRVNAILPTIIDTPLNRNAMPDADFDRWVTPDNVADVCIFLASPAASAITGASIEVFNRV